MDTSTALLIATSTVQVGKDIHLANELLLVLVILAVLDFTRRVFFPKDKV